MAYLTVNNSNVSAYSGFDFNKDSLEQMDLCTLGAFTLNIAYCLWGCTSGTSIARSTVTNC